METDLNSTYGQVNSIKTTRAKRNQRFQFQQPSSSTSKLKKSKFGLRNASPRALRKKAKKAQIRNHLQNNLWTPRHYQGQTLPQQPQRMPLAYRNINLQAGHTKAQSQKELRSTTNLARYKKKVNNFTIDKNGGYAAARSRSVDRSSAINRKGPQA